MAHDIDESIATYLTGLRVEGKADRTAIRDLFGRNAKGADLDHALEVLLSSGLVRVGSEFTGGRPPEIWTVA